MNYLLYMYILLYTHILHIHSFIIYTCFLYIAIFVGVYAIINAIYNNLLYIIYLILFISIPIHCHRGVDGTRRHGVYKRGA